MSFFKKIFNNVVENFTDDNHKHEEDIVASENTQLLSIDEKFIINFKKNGGKFIYCENKEELNEQFENVLEENDWFETEAICFEPQLAPFLEENNIQFKDVENPLFFITSCENLLADDGSILFTSNQIKQKKSAELPENIIIIATASQIIKNIDEGLEVIRKKYVTNYPTNITTFKYFEKSKEEDFLNYGKCPKNLYLLLLEDF